MNKQERQQEILTLLQADELNEVLGTGYLAEKFNVSEATIRRDLQELADNGHIQRQYGGAVPARNSNRINKGAIGLILGSRIDRYMDPFYNVVLEEVDHTLQTYGYHSAYVRTFHEIGSEEEVINLLKAFPVKGIIIIGMTGNSSVEYVRQHCTHTVTISHKPEDHDDVIIFDGYRGMKTMIEHLLGCGYSRMGFITGTPDPRLNGYIDTLRQHKITVEDELIYIDGGENWLPQVGGEGAAYLMSLPEPPEVIVCASDRLATGAMQWLNQHNYKIPHDVAVTGFDNIADSEFLFPALTTVHVHKKLMGQLAVERLVKRIENPEEVPLHIIVPTSLVIRQSCGSQQIPLQINTHKSTDKS